MIEEDNLNLTSDDGSEEMFSTKEKIVPDIDLADCQCNILYY